MASYEKRSCSVIFTLGVICVGLTTLTKAHWVIDDEEYRKPCRGVETCVLIPNCKPVVDFIESQGLSQNEIEILRGYHCGFEGKQIKVCCPDGPIVIGKPEIPIKPNVSSHRNLNLLPLDCGIYEVVSRAYSGIDIEVFQYPWLALISYETATSPDFRCGGSIINDRYILTAAHCITNLSNPKLLKVRLGEYNISSSPDCATDGNGDVTCAPPVQDIAIERAIPHPKYNPQQFTDDIGLIRLASPIDTSVESVKTICLPITPTLRNRNHTNTNLVVAGWGASEYGIKREHKVQVVVTVVTEEACKKLYEKSAAKVTYKQMCVARGKNRRDSCGGDSGGPLLQIDDFHNDGRFVQFGIGSFGSWLCDPEGFSAVYTRTDYYMDWILDNMEP